MDRPGAIKGLDLAGAFYQQLVLPILREHFGHVNHSAGVIGMGSEVLGFDTEMSTDHHWGPRLQLFLADDQIHLAAEISSRLATSLPVTFMGYPTNWTESDDSHVQLLHPIAHGPVKHRVE